MNFIFLEKEELEGLIEKLMNKKLFRRNVFCELDCNLDDNKIKCSIDEIKTSFEEEIIPLLEKHFNKTIENYEYSNSRNHGEGFIFFIEI